jgi:type I restriction enzyme, R subunit
MKGALAGRLAGAPLLPTHGTPLNATDPLNAPLRTRKERAARLRQEHAFFEEYGPEAQQILHALLDKYCEFGPQQLVIPNILQVSPFSSYGNVLEIAQLFGGAPQLRDAVNDLQARLYA